MGGQLAGIIQSRAGITPRDLTVILRRPSLLVQGGLRRPGVSKAEGLLETFMKYGGRYCVVDMGYFEVMPERNVIAFRLSHSHQAEQFAVAAT